MRRSILPLLNPRTHLIFPLSPLLTPPHLLLPPYIYRPHPIPSLPLFLTMIISYILVLTWLSSPCPQNKFNSDSRPLSYTFFLQTCPSRSTIACSHACRVRCTD